MKEFNLEAAKNGAPICTRGGDNVRIVCFDARVGTSHDYPIIALIELNEGKDEILITYTENGKMNRLDESRYDLMMVSVKKKVWVNLYKDDDGRILTGMNTSDSEEKAKNSISDKDRYICTKEIEVEL